MLGGGEWRGWGGVGCDLTGMSEIEDGGGRMHIYCGR